MPAQRRRNLLKQRKRVEDDGDDDVSIVNDAVDDSQSDASLPTDPDDDADADDSDLSDTDGPETVEDTHRRLKSNGIVEREVKAPTHLPDSTITKEAPSIQQSFPPVKDTDMMMNGVQVIQGSTPSEAIDFTSSEQQPSPTQTSNDDLRNINPAERRRREHEEYKKKRDENPAFIPNRGAFFMHDQRNSGQGFRGFGRGRGRGRIEAYVLTLIPFGDPLWIRYFMY
jgi:CASC3/Barentsz eIF4AIII binding